MSAGTFPSLAGALASEFRALDSEIDVVLVYKPVASPAERFRPLLQLPGPHSWLCNRVGFVPNEGATPSEMRPDGWTWGRCVTLRKDSFGRPPSLRQVQEAAHHADDLARQAAAVFIDRYTPGVTTDTIFDENDWWRQVVTSFASRRRKYDPGIGQHFDQFWTRHLHLTGVSGAECEWLPHAALCSAELIGTLTAAGASPREGDREQRPATGVPAVQPNRQAGGAVEPSGELLGVAQELCIKGKELLVIQQIVSTQGMVTIADLGIKCDWPNPDDNWNSMKKRLNKKLGPKCWELYRLGNEAKAKQLSQPKRYPAKKSSTPKSGKVGGRK
jgi:hypothetical protein